MSAVASVVLDVRVEHVTMRIATSLGHHRNRGSEWAGRSLPEDLDGYRAMMKQMETYR
jgi:hypothetical protein